MERGLLVVSILLSTSVFAETGWLSARGTIEPNLRIEAWGGTRSFGAGILRPDTDNKFASLTGELTYAFFDRALELRGARVWQLTRHDFTNLTFSAGGSAHLVPETIDGGLGPHAALTISFGRPIFRVHLGLQTGAELFFRSLSWRLPERISLGFEFRTGDWSLTLAGRTGADIIPTGFILRGEATLSLSWLAL
ncbi:MAG: hypothetical protein ACO1OB_31660 [Archangium sp.]